MRLPIAVTGSRGSERSVRIWNVQVKYKLDHRESSYTMLVIILSRMEPAWGFCVSRTMFDVSILTLSASWLGMTMDTSCSGTWGSVLTPRLGPTPSHTDLTTPMWRWHSAEWAIIATCCHIAGPHLRSGPGGSVSPHQLQRQGWPAHTSRLLEVGEISNSDI